MHNKAEQNNARAGGGEHYNLTISFINADDQGLKDMNSIQHRAK